MQLVTCALVVALTAVASSIVHAETIDFNKVHLVDAQSSKGPGYPSNSFLVRGNAPLRIAPTTGDIVFAYEDVLNCSRARVQEANGTFPSNDSRVYLVDITFENAFDKYFENEALFWANATNADKGKYLHWELLGAVEWATGMTTAQQDAMIQDGTVWKEDQVPVRIQLVRDMLLAGPPSGYDALVVYVHCAGGCDRTGEFVGSYRMNFFHTAQLAPIYGQDVQECGRAPDYYASGALGWFCLTWNLYNSTALSLPPMTDCLTAYTCKLLGSCTATGL
jgi:hypothetical protein